MVDSLPVTDLGLARLLGGFLGGMLVLLAAYPLADWWDRRTTWRRK
jgi:hypothetical protein